MLIKCPECKLMISDKAIMCPHCGLPMTDMSKMPLKRSKRAHKRLPNGFGQITEIKGKALRKPFRAMITVGKTPEGRPICKILKPEGYFSTYNEAYAALVKYNQNPYDLDKEMTMEELYIAWCDTHQRNVKPQSMNWTDNAWRYCNSIYSMKVRDVRTRHLKGCIDDGFILIENEKRRPPKTVVNNMKSLLNMMMDYAVEFELTDRNYSRAFSLSKEVSKEIERDRKNHISFSVNEMKMLWENITTYPYVDILIIHCYTGFRPQELANITINNVDLNNWTIIGGMKTEAGENRIVPIHTCIRNLVKKRYDEAIKLGSDYLFNVSRWKQSPTPMTYSTYKRIFKNIITKFNMNPLHRPHDPKKQFTTMAKKYNVDEYAIKMLVGHKIYDITEKIYTDRDPKWLAEEVEKIRADEYRTNIQIV